MQFLPFRRMLERVERAREDSDTSLFLDLMYYGELVTKLTTIGLVSPILNDTDIGISTSLSVPMALGNGRKSSTQHLPALVLSFSSGRSGLNSGNLRSGANRGHGNTNP